MKLLCVVLCGGRSSRMGTDKAELIHPTGKTFLHHAVDRAKEVSQDVYLSGYARPGATCPTIVDPVAFRGPATGIAAAVARAADEHFAGCLVTPVDMPNLTSKHLMRLRQEWLKSPGELIVAMSAEDGQLQPLVAIYPAGFADSLRALAESERRGLVSWFSTRPHRIFELSAIDCQNINTRADHETNQTSIYRAADAD
ncbi:molybdenum cofactor guanylyltransferase [Novipirellula aureliae]|nr:molybdenum cofactor guanylyltransferase [Novipirellula aureliae]